MQPMAWQWRCHAVLKKGRLMQATHGGPVTAVKDRMHAFSSSGTEASNSRRRVRRRRPAASWTACCLARLLALSLCTLDLILLVGRPTPEAATLRAAMPKKKKAAPKSASKKGKSPAKKKGKAKDPNKPKRPPSAFFLFGSDRRPKLKKEQPDLVFTEVGKTLGAEWRGMSDKQKKKYVTEAAKLKEGEPRGRRGSHSHGLLAAAVGSACAALAPMSLTTQPR
jgi:hypothetical protein